MINKTVDNFVDNFFNREYVCRGCKSFDLPYCTHPKYNFYPLHPFGKYCKGFIREQKNTH